MATFDDLLGIQALDTRGDQLRHRRETLPELAERDALLGSLAERERELAETTARLRELRGAQKECEDHASLLEDKAKEVQTSLYDGSVTSHKELESLTEEQTSLKQRQSDFEDRAIEIMEEAEPVEAELGDRSAQVEAVRSGLEDVEARIGVATAELDGELQRVMAEREQLASSIGAELLESYAGLRAKLGGVAVAPLLGARCEGCHLEIPSAELEAVRRAPADSVVTCPECGRILVR